MERKNIEITHRLFEAVRQKPILDDRNNAGRWIVQILKGVQNDKVQGHIEERHGLDVALLQLFLDALPVIRVLQVVQHILVGDQKVLRIFVAQQHNVGENLASHIGHPLAGRWILEIR